MISAFVLSVALSGTTVPPYAMVENHAQPSHFTQPTVRIFERYEVDHARQLAWDAYCGELDQLWNDYRSAGSTPEAWRAYKAAAAQAKRRYVYQDPYLLPIVGVK